MKNNYNVSRDAGFRQNGASGCAHDASFQCPCDVVVCDSSGTRCPGSTACTNTGTPYAAGCESGKMCSSTTACCEAYTCPSGQDFCKTDGSSPCAGLTQATCVAGCCQPTSCNNTLECWPTYYCSLPQHNLSTRNLRAGPPALSFE